MIVVFIRSRSHQRIFVETAHHARVCPVHAALGVHAMALQAKHDLHLSL